jgi:hypothetical protein
VCQFLYVLAIVFLVASAGWAWFRRRIDSLAAYLEGQFALLKLKLQDVEEQVNALRNELKQKRIIER